MNCYKTIVPLDSNGTNIKENYKTNIYTGAVPLSYDILEYLDSDGTNGIQTDIQYDTSINGEVVFKSLDGENGWIAGLMTNVGETAGNLFGVEGGIYNGAFYILKGCSYSQVSDVRAKTIMYIDYSSSTEPTLKKNQKLGLFYRNYSVAYPDGTWRRDEYCPSKYRVYSAVFRKGSEVIYNLVPAKRKSDGEVGLYDSSTGEFLTRSFGNNFIAGPVITENLYKNNYKTIICNS